MLSRLLLLLYLLPELLQLLLELELQELVRLGLLPLACLKELLLLGVLLLGLLGLARELGPAPGKARLTFLVI